MRGIGVALLLAVSWPSSGVAAEQSIERTVQLATLSLEGLENPPTGAETPEVVPPADVAPPAIEDSPEGDSPEGREVRPYAPLRSHHACPTDADALSAALIRDIPNYSNRVLQRTTAVLRDGSSTNPETSPLTRRAYRPSYVLVAGSQDLEPLDLKDYAFTTAPEAGGPLTQVFFTTLSRQYSGLRFDEVQEYHWLFLVEADDGWWLSFMFSSIDDADAGRSPSPPRENSRGSVGQAVQLWLRDCRAGAIEPLE